MSPTPQDATLGSLLWNQDGVTAIRGWLGVSDFPDPWHAEVYRTLLTHPSAPCPDFAVGVGVALRDRIGPRRADLPRFAALAGGAPPRPDHLAYARLVLEASLFRQFASFGLVLRAGAAAAASQRNPHPLHEALDHVQRWTGQAREQWRAAHSNGHLSVSPDTAASARCDILLGADRFLVTHPTPTAADTATAEGLLVGAVLARPGGLPAIAAVRAEHLTNPLAGATLAAIRSLAAAGEHIDTVTVTAHLTRTTAYQSEQVATRLGEWADAGAVRDLHHLATTVLLNTAVAWAIDIDQSLRDPTPAPLLEVLAEIGARLDRLRGLARGLTPSRVVARPALCPTSQGPPCAADDAFILQVG